MRKKIATTVLSALCLLILILDMRTVSGAVTDGIRLCIESLIPSVFPLMLLTGILTKNLSNCEITSRKPAKSLRLFSGGSVRYWLIGSLSGYPVGAKNINDACRIGTLSAENGRYLLSFCSNCGPAFIFGMLGSMLNSDIAPWVLWLNLLLSSMITGYVFKPKESILCKNSSNGPSAQCNLWSSICGICVVCVWVIIFRIILAFASKWFLYILPVTLRVGICSFLELTNGFTMLEEISNPATRYIIASCSASFGGICVLMQTASVTDHIGLGHYFPGKLLQTAINFYLSVISQILIYPKSQRCHPSPFFLTVTALIIISIIAKKYCKKVVAIREKMLYNAGNA